MTTGIQRWFATTTTALLVLAGCAQPGPLTSRRTMVSQLKASVAQTQQDNDRLKREVADLQVENRQVADRLDEEEQDNGQLHARLDDARSALRSEGSSLAEVSPPTSPAGRRGSTRTVPASRSPRRAPFARIPSRIEDSSMDDLEATEPSTRNDLPSSRTREREREPNREDLGPQTRRDRTSQWLPVRSGDRALR